MGERFWEWTLSFTRRESYFLETESVTYHAAASESESNQIVFLLQILFVSKCFTLPPDATPSTLRSCPHTQGCFWNQTFWGLWRQKHPCPHQWCDLNYPRPHETATSTSINVMHMPKQEVAIPSPNRETVLANHKAGKISDRKRNNGKLKHVHKQVWIQKSMSMTGDVQETDHEAPSPLNDRWQCMTGDVQETDDDMIWPPLNGLTVWKMGITASTRLILKGRAGIVYDHFYRSFSHFFFFFFLRLALGSERAKPGSTATSRTALLTQQHPFHYSHETCSLRKTESLD